MHISVSIYICICIYRESVCVSPDFSLFEYSHLALHTAAGARGVLPPQALAGQEEAQHRHQGGGGRLAQGGGGGGCGGRTGRWR